MGSDLRVRTAEVLAEEIDETSDPSLWQEALDEISRELSERSRDRPDPGQGSCTDFGLAPIG